MLSSDRATPAESVRHPYEPRLPVGRPDRPRLASGLAVAADGDRLLVMGGPAPHVFTGRSATTLLAAVIETLDGRRDLAAVAEEIGAPERHVETAIDVLYRRGLLEDGPPGEDPSAAERFFARSLDITRAHRTGGRALSRLRQAAVAVIGPEAAVDAVRESLRADDVQAEAMSADRPEYALVISLADESSGHRHEHALLAASRESGTFILYARYSGSLLHLGPLVTLDDEPCPVCLARLWDLADRPASQLALEWPAVVSGEAIRFLSGVGELCTRTGVVQTDFATQSQQSFPVPYRRLCAAAHAHGPDVNGSHRALALVGLYEQAIELPCPRLHAPSEHADVRISGKYTALTRDHTHYPTAPFTPLPDVGGEEDVPAAAPRLALDGLALLLTVATGLRNVAEAGAPEATIRRWSPTGGNLGSVELYLWARNVAGLEDGAYYFDGFAHGLSRLDSPARPMFSAAELGPGTAEGDGTVVLIFVGALRRAAIKYSHTALHLVLLDAGHALASVAQVCGLLRLTLQVGAKSDEQTIAARLDLDLQSHVVTTVAALGV